MVRNTFKIIYVFYTFWGLIFHLLYFLGYLPNTRLIALFIWIVSQFFLFVWPNYLKMYGMSRNSFWREVIFHWIPVWLVPATFSWAGFGVLIASLGLYLRVHGPKRVFELYKDKKRVLKEWLEQKTELIEKNT